MDVPQRIARAVVAQLDELLAVADVVRKRHASALQPPRARQRERAARVAARQHHQLSGQIDADRSVDEPERVRAQQAAALEAQHPAPQRRYRQRDLDAVTGGSVRQLRLLDVGATAAPDQLHPAREADPAVHPVHLRIAARHARGGTSRRPESDRPARRASARATTSRGPRL